MFCNECGARIPSTAKYCDSCGNAVTKLSGETVEHVSSPEPEHSQSLVANFTSGNYGLARTFWLFGIVVWLFYLLFETYLVVNNNMRLNAVSVIVPAAFIIYLFFVIPAIWNAATQYRGLKLWAVLAKGVCIVWIVQLCGVVIRLVTAAFA